ncbi:MAG TPA: beta-ketoacyl synthase chain length factor [Kofleriaceae bacterium]|jgi:hypothetical protein
MIELCIRDVSLFSTRHASAHDVIAGIEREATPPAYKLLVGRARRFTSLVTQLHMEVAGALTIEPERPPVTVFATTHGEIQTAENLIADFRDNRVVSSARFALSVHNTPSGLYSVATGNTAASTTLTGANAIAASWLEAALTVLDADRDVLLSIADEPIPAVFHGPSEPSGIGAAFLLAQDTGRAAQLAIVDEARAPIDAGTTLAQLAEAIRLDAAATVHLGQLSPTQALELRVAAR